MSRKTYGVVGLGAMLAIAAYLGIFSEKPRTPSEEQARAAFTRPTVLAPAAGDFGIFIEGVDALSEVPKVPCNELVSLMLALPPNDPQEVESIWIVTRLPSQGPEGFEWMDIHCDVMLGLNDPKPATLGDGRQFRMKAKFSLKPGDYVVRYYRQLSHFDPEKGPPRNEYLGQGRLEVTASKSESPSFLPLEDKRNTIHLLRPQSEEM